MNPCGTYGGYQAHRRRAEEACRACKDATNAYHKTYRQKPAVRAKVNAVTAAQSRALWRLATAHRAEFRRLYQQEKTP